MLPDLSGRLDRVGGRTMVAQQTRRAAVASGIHLINIETKNLQKKRRNAQKKLKLKNLKTAQKIKVTTIGGPLPNSDIVSNNSHYTTTTTTTTTTSISAPPLHQHQHYINIALERPWCLPKTCRRIH